MSLIWPLKEEKKTSDFFFFFGGGEVQSDALPDVVAPCHVLKAERNVVAVRLLPDNQRVCIRGVGGGVLQGPVKCEPKRVYLADAGTHQALARATRSGRRRSILT